MHKAPDDLAILIKSRIDEHVRAEQERERQQREAEEKRQAEAAEAKPAAEQEPQPSPDLFVLPAVAANPEPEAERGAPTLRLGMINERLGFSVSVQLLASLGFTATQEGAARLYHEADFIPICRALVAHIRSVATGEQQQAA